MMGGMCVISPREDGSVYVLQSAFQLSGRNCDSWLTRNRKIKY